MTPASTGPRARVSTSSRVESLLAALTLAEKCRLLSGEDLWSTVPVDRVGIPKIQVTDGPSGARGPDMAEAPRAAALSVPSAGALGATFDTDLVEAIGAAIGADARDKACRVLLAPTVNLHRSPLGGRAFECYSEDPLLSGVLAAAFVRGAQSQGVACTVKHLVGNDAETERYTMSSQIDDRTLRELYLRPFEIAVRDGGALGIMTGYNRLNGTWCGDHEWLLREVLRGDWGFDGFVISDWFAIAAGPTSVRAGLDLEMPGPPRTYADLADAVERGEVDERFVDERIRCLLSVFDHLGALDDPARPPEPAGHDRDTDRRLVARAAAEAIVLLRNDAALLPLEADRLRRVALLGPNAITMQTNGGGSASVRSHPSVTLTEALRDALPGVELVVEAGAALDRSIPVIPTTQLRTPAGDPGILVEYFDNLELAGSPASSRVQPTTDLTGFGVPRGLPDDYSFRATAHLEPLVGGDHQLALYVGGRGRVLLNGEVVCDLDAVAPRPGREAFGMLSEPATATVRFDAGSVHELVIEYKAVDTSLLKGARVGLAAPSTDDLLARAVAAARSAEVAVVVVGTDPQWESEGHDRIDMSLPPGHAELVAAVVAAQPNTVVVVNAGTIVDVGFADGAPALLHSWFGGQEAANALAAVLLGRRDPGGRLPTTIPQRVEHTPAYGAFPGENSVVRYGEGLLMGYRWYDSRHLPVRYPFGHGLSYTSFEIGTPRLSSTTVTPDAAIVVDVEVTNVGDRAGHEVVQCYVAPASPTLFRPAQELVAFAKVTLEPGVTQTVRLELDARAFAHWDPADPGWEERRRTLRTFQPFGGLTATRRASAGWYVDGGDYEVRIGRSSRDIVHRVVVAADQEHLLA